MRTLLLLKRIDLWMQLLALIVPIVLAVMKKETWFPIFCYYTVGGAQIISCIINKVGMDDFISSGGRRRYERMLLVMTGLAGIVWLNYKAAPGIIIIYGFGLLVMGTVMRIWYGTITVEKIMTIKKLVDRKQYV